MAYEITPKGALAFYKDWRNPGSMVLTGEEKDTLGFLSGIPADERPITLEDIGYELGFPEVREVLERLKRREYVKETHQ